MSDKIERAARDLYQNIPDEPGIEPTDRNWDGLTDSEREHWRDHVRNILRFFPSRLDGLYESDVTTGQVISGGGGNGGFPRGSGNPYIIR